MVCVRLGIAANMHPLGDTIDQRAALQTDSLCKAALAIFIREPDRRAIAITDGDNPVGLLYREPFMVRMEVPGAGDRPVFEAAERDPLTVEVDEDVRAVFEAASRNRPTALLDGFIVVRHGAFVGVCDLLRLLPALSTHQSMTLVEHLCDEVREPTAHALAAAEGLRRLRLPDGAAAHLDTIADAARATLTLLDVAADLQRAEEGRLEIVAEPRRLQALMDDIEARWRNQAEATGATLLVSYDGAPECAAIVDGTRLMQVFDALIGHAMTRSGRGVIEASLLVRAADRGFTLTGRVRDNGEAYESAYLAGLFRGDSRTDRTGLRLELMRAEHAIAAMAGTIEARANPGAGATISFEITTDAAEGDDATETAGPSAASRSAHVLVVDDNATNRMVVEALCEMFDCSTESVVDGVEAVEAAKAGRFDVILMDIKMPRMDGVTAAREIRKLTGSAGRVPIIALTANADADEVAQYLAAGMRSVVEKPIKPDRLMEALDEALSGGPAKAVAA